MASSQRERLEQEALQIKARIKKCNDSEREEKKKKDTRRRVLAGAAVLAKVERGDWSEEGFLKMMDAFLSRPSDRLVFGLPILDELSEQSEESSLESSASNVTADRQVTANRPKLSGT